MSCRFAVNCNDWAFFAESVISLGRRRFWYLTQRGFLLRGCVELRHETSAIQSARIAILSNCYMHALRFSEPPGLFSL